MNLNVWTQSITEGDKKPVIVFFHGGGYRNGSSIESAAYDGKNLSEYGDVVVVTLIFAYNFLCIMANEIVKSEKPSRAGQRVEDVI